MRRFLSAVALAACLPSADPVVQDCADVADFTACVSDAGTAMCLGEACTVLDACAPADCGAGPTFPIPDTLLAACQGPDGPIACPGDAGSDTCAATPLCGQDAQYGWDVGHAREDRFSVQQPDAQAVVHDEVTALTWQGCARGQGPGCEGDALRGDWFEADAFCQDSSWGGHDDWVLPDAWALQSIVDYGTTSPAIDTTAFRNAPSRFAVDDQEWWIECTWTSTDGANDGDLAWAVMVNSGDVLLGSGVPYHPHDKAAADWVGCYTRCVREHAPPQHQRFLKFEVGTKPVVADTIARRTWQGCSLGQVGATCNGQAARFAWADALAACEGLDWGGYQDWRLPNVIELRSLVDLRAFRPAIDSAMFPNTPAYDGSDDLSGQYWTSTARWYNGFALYVSFHDGGSHFYVQDEERHVRCVRGPDTTPAD